MASILRFLFFSIVFDVTVVIADITSSKVRTGDCVCPTTSVNARDKAGLSSNVVLSLTQTMCGTIYGGILTRDGYKWFEIKYNGQRLWVAGRYLASKSSSSCGSSSSSGGPTGSCSSQQREKACTLLNLHKRGVVDLASRHPSGVSDNAYAYNNINDMCNGHKASRSSYSCSTCPSGTPGGSVCLTNDLLDYLIYLANKGKIIVNELAGACHSCSSRHYNGQAVDLHNDARTSEYLRTCVTMGGWSQDEGDHVHCQFYD